jgi:hypothetical protein
VAQKRLPYHKLSKTGKHYRDNPKSAAKRNKASVKRGKTQEGKAYRAKHKRMRNAAEKKGLNIKGKDIEKSTGKPVSIKVNRGRLEKSRLKGSKRK